MILDNLRKAGVQNTGKGERLTFDRLDPFPGDVDPRRRASTPTPTARPGASPSRIGPEHGTVGAAAGQGGRQGGGPGRRLRPAARLRLRLRPARQPRRRRRYGKLTVLPARMNPDLAMGDELLKKTGAGNLFMVFGEPDVEITKQKDGQLVVEIRGVDVYDPTTGRDPHRRPPTTSPAGSSTPTTTARASSSATPTSPAPTNPTTS